MHTQEEQQKAQSILDSLTEALNMAPMVVQKEEPEEVASAAANKRAESLEDDFEYARRNIKKTIDDATASLQQLMLIARQSEHPRAFEVVSTYVNTLVTANQSLLDLYKKRATADGSIGKKAAASAPSIGQQNNVFVGTTDELDALLASRKKAQVIDHGTTSTDV